MIVERLNLSAGDPFDIDDLCAHARVDQTDTDELFRLVSLARAAMREAEELGQLAVLHQTIRITLDAWPEGDTFRPPVFPILDPNTVTVTGNGEPFEGFGTHIGWRPRIVLLSGRPQGPVVIEYQAGFGPDAASLPADLSQAILDQATASFDTRGASDARSAVSPHFTRIIGRYRGVRF